MDKNNTYTVTGTIMGISREFNVTILESPIKSIEIEDVYVIENTRGYESDDVYYYTFFDPEFSVTLKSGEILKSSGSRIQINNNWYSLEINTDSQYYEPWTKNNTYSVTGTLMGVSGEFNVTILETIIQSLDIEDISIYEFTHGHYNDEEYVYDDIQPDFKVTLITGEVIKSSNGGAIIDGYWYSFDINTDSQHSEPWTKNNTYTVTGTIMGVSREFNVTILESPIKSIEIDDVYIIENSDYSKISPSFSATLKTGETLKSNKNGTILVNGESFSVIHDCNEIINTTRIGKKTTAIGKVGGASNEFNITVIKNPIISIAKNNITLIDGLKLKYIEDILEFDITLNSGKTITGGLNNFFVNISGVRYDLYDNLKIEDYDSSVWRAGNTYKLNAELLGIKFDIDVKIIPNDYKSVTIEGKDSLIINLEKNDGTIDSFKAILLDVRGGSGGGVWDGGYEDSMVGGFLKMDKTIFVPAVFYYHPEQTQNNVCLELSNSIKSNRIDGCYWLKSQLTHLFNDRSNDIIIGDINDDGKVTDQDAIYLLFHNFFSDYYPVNQTCDFNKDGFITDQDAMYLLFSLYFEDFYPIY